MTVEQAKHLTQQERNEQILAELYKIWQTIMIAKSGAHSAENRHYQIILVDLQKIIGYFSLFTAKYD